MKKLILILLCFQSLIIFGQTDSISQRIKDLFPSGKMTWIKNYKGRIDDLSDVSIVLGFDGKFCRGYMTYLRSSEKFLLDGTFIGDTLLLTEMDIRNTVSGSLKGVQKGKRIEGIWSNYNKTIGGIQILMTEVADLPTIPSFCGDNKWIHGYRGKFDGQLIDVLLQKGSFGAIRGTGFFTETGKSFNIKGTYDDIKLGMELTLKDDNSNKIGSLSLRLKSLNELVGTFIQPDGKKYYGEMSRNDNIDVGCIEFADYVASYDITYPKLKNPKFDLWMQGLVEEWFRINIAYINSIHYDNLDNVPEVRNVARAYGWCDLNYCSAELFSGYMVFGNSWTNRQRERVFIYDLVYGKEINKEDIFLSGIDAEAFLKNKIDNALKNNILYTEPDFKDWIATQKFDNITIRQEGINFSSTGIVYGRQGVTITYKEQMPFLRQGGAIWKMANR